MEKIQARFSCQILPFSKIRRKQRTRKIIFFLFTILDCFSWVNPENFFMGFVPQNDILVANYRTLSFVLGINLKVEKKHFATVTQKLFYELVVVLCYDYQMAGTSSTSYCHNLLPGNDRSLSSLPSPTSTDYVLG